MEYKNPHKVVQNAHQRIVRGFNNHYGPYLQAAAAIGIPASMLAYILPGWLKLASSTIAVLAYLIVLFLCWHAGRS